jgi:hypothetical protein
MSSRKRRCSLEMPQGASGLYTGWTPVIAYMEFTPVEPGPGKPADVTLLVNGKETGKGRVAKTVPFRYSVEPFDVGRDTVSPVTEDYKVPFAFQGRIEHVTVEVK